MHSERIKYEYDNECKAFSGFATGMMVITFDIKILNGEKESLKEIIIYSKSILPAPHKVGNQMFEYAALRGILKIYGYDFMILPLIENVKTSSF